MKQVYSKHIFIFPFTWAYYRDGSSYNFDERVNLQGIREKFEHGDKNTLFQLETLNIEDHKKYNEYMYFYENARKAIYTYNENIYENVYNYSYKGQREKDQYIIHTLDKVYTLEIDSIQLKMYKTGIGILSFHLSNKDSHTTPLDILRINEYGRRIYAPFLPIQVAKKKVLADRVALKLREGKVIVEDFKQSNDKNPYKISNLIMKLLGHGFKDSQKDLTQNDILIRPIIDDRMFTMCWYANHHKIEAIQKRGLENAHEFWYPYVFIDENHLSYGDEDTFKSLIHRHTYSRWLYEGSLYGISRYSFMLLTGKIQDIEEDFTKVLIEHFDSMYFQMVSLLLAQRASILRFSNEISRIAGLDKENIGDELENLYGNYMKFINCFYFREVTAQAQGIEIYDRFIEDLHIERDMKELKDEMDGLYQYVRFIQEKKTKSLLDKLSLVGAVFIVPTFIVGFFGMNMFEQPNFYPVQWIEIIKWMIFISVPSIPIFMIFIGLWYKKGRKKSK